MGRHVDTARLAARPPIRATGSTRWPRALGLAAIACAGIALSACGGDDDEAADAQSAALADRAAAESAGDGAIAFDATAGSGTDGAPAAPTFDLGTIGRDVIVEMQIAMSSDDIARTVATISARAAALGGGVASSNVDYGDPNQPDEASGFATLVVKVPPAAVDALVGGLDETGIVRSINQSAQDVTDQLVDLDVRIANARQSVTNVREFMERTQDLTELVTLESELTRRLTELEQLEAQQRNVSDRVALSTITIGILPTAAVPDVAGDDGIGDAFADGWSAFLAVVYGLAIVLATTAPFLVGGAMIAAAAWFVARRRRAAGGATQPLPGPVTPSVSDRDDVPTPTA